MRLEEEIITRDKKNSTTLRARQGMDQPNINPFNFYGNGIRLGLLAGIGMSIYLFITNAAGFDNSIGIKYLKYILLLGTLAYGLKAQKNALGEIYTFRAGMSFGLFISVISATVLLIAALLSYGLSDTLAFQKFNIDGGEFGYTAVVGALIFIETFVYGMIMTFIILQFIKDGEVKVNA